jgi:hypothetical protein
MLKLSVEILVCNCVIALTKPYSSKTRGNVLKQILLKSCIVSCKNSGIVSSSDLIF